MAMLTTLVAHLALAGLGNDRVEGGVVGELGARDCTCNGIAYVIPRLEGGWVLRGCVEMVRPSDLGGEAVEGVRSFEVLEGLEAVHAGGAVGGHCLFQALLALSLVEEKVVVLGNTGFKRGIVFGFDGFIGLADEGVFFVK
jgi:hypothetical protein